MQIPVDNELVTASVYGVAMLVYVLLWFSRSRHWYIALAVVALILATLAACKSDQVRNIDLIHGRSPPVFETSPGGEFLEIAKLADRPGSLAATEPSFSGNV
jgi:hypothetical protein